MFRLTSLSLFIVVTFLVAPVVARQPATSRPATKPTTAPKPRPFPATQATMIPLYPDGVPGSLGNTEADEPRLVAFPAPGDKANGTAVIVCPGGGYANLAAGHEGFDVAHWLNDHGITAFVLRYRVGPYKHPAELSDGLTAVRIIRSRAAEWNIAPGKLGMLGFSAGGHLVSSVGTHFDFQRTDASLPLTTVSARPDFLVLIYPVISMDPALTHAGSRANLIGVDADAKLTDFMSSDKQVTARTPPTFLAHSDTDAVVQVENSIRFHEALKKHDIASELLRFDHGGHGYGMAPSDPTLNIWTARLVEWMKKEKFLTEK